ncbi:hypothetical protein QP794_25615 [Paenibacillus sp. UMB7766-LJ446]|uniref:ABC-three component system middle component 7 n=1 Tax=Paenibacillus sp. UMB7766-LJ446 TaxID=3046313 RepID=UPI00254E6DAE|nr:ABC-three component system middle component 7 [Paenibacillus sp. UMB7766-LJ446]MDK8193474.1 hypothetical protein [Paenibacillus sp. UMB7766-LJ446]
MIVPNKVVNYEESIIGKMIPVLESLRNNDNSVEKLFYELQEIFDGVEEFIYTIEALFILDVINVDLDTGGLEYVERNSL